MEGKKTTVRLEECMRFGGDSYQSLEVRVHDIVREDVDIIKGNGQLEHGFRVTNTNVLVANFFSRVNDIDLTIKSLEELVESLKEQRDG